MNHIELFAGCGGLSLGLETAGFELVLANELSPMASETFAYNHLKADLCSEENTEKVLWLSSKYSRDQMKSRLRENPMTAAGLTSEHVSDLEEINPSDDQLSRSLLVGSIRDLNELLDRNIHGLKERISNGFGKGEIDLVSGGPPCQSFSLAGMRDHSSERNQLPWEFAKFVEHVQPKIALLENVTGILRPFNIEGKKYFAWFEVAKAFCKIGYTPLCLHVNAKYAGVAQNRPRFIMIALREDVFRKYSETSVDTELVKAYSDSHEFRNLVLNGLNPDQGLMYYDSEKDEELFNSNILSRLLFSKEKMITVKDAIDDLRSGDCKESEYIECINNTLLNIHDLPIDKSLNHEKRGNSNKVKARFRIYQLISKLEKEDAKSIEKYLKHPESFIPSEKSIEKISKNWVFNTLGEKVDRPTAQQILELLSELHTKKQTQRALVAGAPAPAALSIPDDACHYYESIETLRTLTVREMARIQSFPDWYHIRSKVTTGGKMRKFEVPQYTQIGNAVPPLLGLALGQVCLDVLNEI